MLVFEHYKMNRLTNILVFFSLGVGFCEPVRSSYGPPSKEETEVEIQKVEVYEVPWIGDKQLESSYGPPQTQYGPPFPSYSTQDSGPPEEATTTADYPSITTTTPPEIVTNSSQNETERLTEFTGKSTQGQYYIYHPTGLLQKVTYVTKDDEENMAFAAQLKYKNVEPVRGPIYTYDPSTLVFSRLNRR